MSGAGAGTKSAVPWYVEIELNVIIVITFIYLPLTNIVPVNWIAHIETCAFLFVSLLITIPEWSNMTIFFHELDLDTH